MSALPHGYSEPLHYLAPFPWWQVTAAGLALAGALLLRRWWRRRRRRDTAGAVPASALPRPAAPPAGGIAAQLEWLEQRHLATRSYRQGCHELSLLLRRHLEDKRRRPFSRWTAREARRAEGDNVWTRLLALVADLQFARRPPLRSDFAGACELAHEVLTVEERG